MGSAIKIDNAADSKKDSRRILNVIFFDLLSIMPYYDTLLVNSMEKLNPLMLAATTFQRDKTYYNRYGMKNGVKIIDIAVRLNFLPEKLRKLFKLFEYILNLIILWLRFTVSRPDIVHLQWIPRIYFVRFELWFMRAVKALGIKQVYTIHNVLPHDTGTRYKNLFADVYNLVDGIICHTNNARQQVIDEFDIAPEKIKVIPFGPILHDSSKFHSIEGSRRYLGIQDNSVAVLAFGNIKPYKGLEFLLNAWLDVVKTNPDALLIIAGNGNPGYLNRLKGMIFSNDIQNSVIPHFDYLTDDELNMYHQAADILVYPYEDITQSGAVLTGMSFGKAIVASDLPGFQEIIDNCRSGLLFRQGDTEGFVSNLSRLIQSSDERERLGRNVLIDVQHKYTWENAAASTVDFYHEVLGASR